MTEHWEPFNFERDGLVRGISVDILVLLLERVGSAQGRNDIQILPWMRAYKTIEQQHNTILFTTARTEGRERSFREVGPIFENEFGIYALKKRQIKIKSLKGLERYKFGTVRGDVTEELLTQKTGLKVEDFDQAPSYINNMKKLSDGRVDLVVISNDDIITELEKDSGLDFNDFERIYILDKKSMYYAFHKDTSDWVIKAFQKAFNDLKKEGKIAKIFHKYGR